MNEAPSLFSSGPATNENRTEILKNFDLLFPGMLEIYQETVKELQPHVSFEGKQSEFPGKLIAINPRFVREEITRLVRNRDVYKDNICNWLIEIKTLDPERYAKSLAVMEAQGIPWREWELEP